MIKNRKTNKSESRKLTLEERLSRLEEGLFDSYGSFAWLANTIRKAREIVGGVNGSRNARRCCGMLHTETDDDAYNEISYYLSKASDFLEIAEKLLGKVEDDQGFYKR